MNDQRVTGWASASAVSGRTVAALRAMVAQGELHADRDDRNRNVFSRVDLEALRPADLPEPGPQAGQSGTTPTSDGELAARVIEDLEAGRSLHEIAVAHRVAPDVLMQLHDAWRRLHEADLHAASVPKELADLTRAVVGLHERLAAVEEAVAELQEQMALRPIIAFAPHDCEGSEEGEERTIALAGTCVECHEQVLVVLVGRE